MSLADLVTKDTVIKGTKLFLPIAAGIVAAYALNESGISEVISHKREPLDTILHLDSPYLHPIRKWTINVIAGLYGTMATIDILDKYMK
jgi:hypothetical protein